MESVWVDIHKQSNKDLERKEDDVDLLSYDDFVKYLKNTYESTYSSYPIRTEPSLSNPAMMLIQIPLEIQKFDGVTTKTRVPVLTINYQTKSQGFHSYDKEQATCIALSSKFTFDAYPELEDMLGEKYDVDKSNKQATPPGPVIVDSKTGPLLNSQCVDIIDIVLSVLKNPLVSKKTNESIWMDIHKRSTGDTERREESIDMMDINDFITYLQSRYKCNIPRKRYKVENWFLGGEDTLMQVDMPIEDISEPGIKMTYTLRLTYDYGKMECIDIASSFQTFFEEYPEFKKYVSDNYQLIKKSKEDFRSFGSDNLIVSKPGKKLMFHDYVELIDKALSCVKKPYLKLNESVWMDIHKQSTGDIDRKEDDINNFSPNEFWEYLREIYFDGDLGYNDIRHFDYGINRSFSKNLFEITIPFGIVETVFNGKTYKRIQSLYLKINDETYKYEPIEISDDVKGLEEILSENGYVFRKRLPPKSSIVYPKNGEITNKTIINLIDLLLKTTEFPMLKKR